MKEKCSICGKNIQTIHMANHMKQHVANQVIVLPIHAVKSKCKTEKCPICAKEIQAIHLENHLRKKHKVSNDKKNSAVTISKPPRSIFVETAPEPTIEMNTNVAAAINWLKSRNADKSRWAANILTWLNNNNVSKSFTEVAGYLANNLPLNIRNQSQDYLKEILLDFSDFFTVSEEEPATRYMVNPDSIVPALGHHHNYWEQVDYDLLVEERAAKANKERVRVTITSSKSVGNAIVYSCGIRSSEDTAQKVPDNVRVFVISENGIIIGQATILRIDLENMQLSMQSSTDFNNGNYILQYSTAWLIENLRNNLGTYQEEIRQSIVCKLLQNQQFDNTVNRNLFQNFNFPENQLNESQQTCFQYAITNSLTFIWGPPGTGKSTTVAEIIKYFFINNQKTLICTTANVALDGILLKTLESLERGKSKEEIRQIQGKVLRVGNVFSKAILEKEYLFNLNHQIEEIRRELIAIQGEIERLKDQDSDKLDNQLALRLQAEHELKNQLREVYNKAHLIFSTVSFSLIDSVLKEMKFVNVIVDEISMMNIPYLLWLSKFSTVRIIVAGDFRQLGPISQSGRETTYGWMKKDVFKLVNSDYNFENLKFVKMITEQYRMHTDISNLINDVFYNGELRVRGNTLEINRCRHLLSEEHTSIQYIKTPENSRFQYIDGGSRKNEWNRNKVLEMIRSLKDLETELHIAIITPYRAQANDYRIAIPKLNSRHKISFGTIHTFQGSEADIVFIDFVDTERTIDGNASNISRLYNDQDGERLINVAISRAKSKLVIIGDLDHLTQSNTNLTTSNFRNILLQIRQNYSEC